MAKRQQAGAASPPVDDPLSFFHAPVRDWFQGAFAEPTRPQKMGWPAIARGDSTLILAPTGTGKTLAAFLWCINKLMFTPTPSEARRCRILYISPIKALAVDVERNLRAPLIGIGQAARRSGTDYHEPAIAIRTGDTTAAERARFARHPSDILITTPESLYLLLTSNAREVLRSIETVILDEIHALVPTKRGSHLALSLERLEQLCDHPLQRIGLSATQRPLEEVAHYLGGAESAKIARAEHTTSADSPVIDLEATSAQVRYRPVTIVDAGEPKRFDIRVEVPVEDMAHLDKFDTLPSGPASQGPIRPSIWTAIHPRLLEMVRAHRSTIIFVNSRRLAERISGAINDLAGETLVRAHHGSVAVAQRKEIEDSLKMGTIRGLVATSSLELGIDMGAVDLVVQIEAPPSVASGMQRIGRASHQVGAVSKGTIYPKYRSDLVACAAVTRAMIEGKVESVRYPRNALDVLAQQIVAMIAMDTWSVNDLYSALRRAAPYAGLTRPVFESVLDMLAGRYPSDEFAELRPRLTWDRVSNTLTPRQGARNVAVINGGTIPDRGLYPVFVAGINKGARVGELDEEMVFESRTGDTIILGASTWRIEEISHDRVVVAPAPGEPGKMPFWHGDGAGRPAEFGREIGQMTRELLRMPRTVAFNTLVEQHSLDANAAENLLSYLEDEMSATGRVPSDEEIVVERCRDELGDWRICVLTPYGTKVHAPWCMAVTAKLRAERGLEVESMWAEDGFVLRLPETEEPLETEGLFPSAAEFRDLLLRQLGSTSVFAAKFRECASRALLLPKRRPGTRAPLWAQRKRAADLLGVAARYSTFPILLETYRECMRDVFDIPSATTLLRHVASGKIRVTTVDSPKPSPFASALLFSYIANYIYEGDAPLAERRAQALAIDQAQLQELLGDTDLRELLDAAALDEVEANLQALDPDHQARHADAVHDLLQRLGDLSRKELEARCSSPEVAATIDDLLKVRRALQIRLAGEARFIAVEDAARYRDAFGVPLPPGLPGVWLESASDPLLSIARRWARTHGPFTTTDLAKRFSVELATFDGVLRLLHAEGKLLEGEFRPTGVHREWCDPDVLQMVRRRTLARLRREIEPVEQHSLARLLTRWQGVAVPRRGVQALLDAIAVLQGAPLLASELEREVLPARVADYRPGDLDDLMASGEVMWVGLERVGERDGRIALYLGENLSQLLPPLHPDIASLSDRARHILETLERKGASFFAELHTASGDGFPGDTSEALWELVWAGVVTNDTMHPLRTFLRPEQERQRHAGGLGAAPGSVDFLHRLRPRDGSRGLRGRWSLVAQRLAATNDTQWIASFTQQLLVRYGIVSRDVAAAENVPGGYSSVYPALRTMEESGWIRRGMFVAGLGAAQFAMPSAVEMLRTLRHDPETPEVIHLAATDPANPYGSLLPWPRAEQDNEGDGEKAASHGLSRTSGASVILVNGSLAAFLRRRNPALRVFLPEEEPDRSHVARALAMKLAEVALQRQGRKTGLLVGEINGQPPREHFVARFLLDAGFVDTALGLQMRRVSRFTPSSEEAEAVTAEAPEEEDSEAETESA